MKKQSIKPIALAVGLALAAPAAMAVNLDFSGSNIYMKFLDGDQRIVNKNDKSGDTASGTDQGQWTEMELRIKAVISPKVEAGVRIQSRSSNAFWSEYGFDNNEGFGDAGVKSDPNKSKFMKLRGAYIQLTPGYSWLNMARIGGNDWGMFDPFTVGKIRYIDRDNYNGFYFKGPLGAGSWEAARVTLPKYLQTNYGGELAEQEATYIGQVKFPVAGAKVIASAQSFSDRNKKSDITPFDGQDIETYSTNRVYMVKAEGAPTDGIEVKGAYYRSTFDIDKAVDNWWSLSPNNSVSDNAFKLDLSVSNTGVRGLTFAYQYFNIGEGFYSNTAARTEADVLLTEGSEAAWYRWGDAGWNGGATSDYIQGASGPRGERRANGSTIGLGNSLTDNTFKDFNEAPSQSAIGWKGHTLKADYEVANTPMSLELTRIGYNSDRQNYAATGALANWYSQNEWPSTALIANQDRKTSVAVFKASHGFQVAGGLDAGFKAKWVTDTDKGSAATATDNAETKDSGYSFTLGNQLHNDLYGSIGYGHYNRDITVGAKTYENDKGIWTLKLNYSLAGFETGFLAQWISGDGDPTMSGTRTDVSQYRLKATVQAVF